MKNEIKELIKEIKLLREEIEKIRIILCSDKLEHKTHSNKPEYEIKFF